PAPSFPSTSSLRTPVHATRRVAADSSIHGRRRCVQYHCPHAFMLHRYHWVPGQELAHDPADAGTKADPAKSRPFAMTRHHHLVPCFEEGTHFPGGKRQR